ncbi:MAG: bifunctional UDP-sugar hydrolase/5'-nucleotidase [bacterium]
MIRGHKSRHATPATRHSLVLGGLLFILLSLPFSAEGRLVEIRVLHTTDIHGHLLPTRDYEGNENVGGLLRCATLIRQLRAEQPNVLLIDCGDLYQGGAESFLTGGRIMIRAINELKYDAWVLGNHEFDWGIEQLIGLQDTASVPVLAANIVTRPDLKNPLSHVRPFMVKEVDGLRIAIIGLITPGVPSWSRPDLLGGLEFEHSVQTLARIMPAVREAEPDIILLATHQGFRPHGDDHANEIKAIAAAFPEIDVIIGGHLHRAIEDVRIRETLYTQAGYYANWLGCVDLSYDTVTRRLVNRVARVLPIGTQVAEDAELKAVFQKDLDRAEEYLAEHVGATRDTLGAKPDAFGRSPVQTLIARAIAEATHAAIVLHGALSKDELVSGEIRMKDVWRIVPYENRIGVMMLTSAELTDILNENMRNRGRIQFMGAYGLDFDTERRDGNTVVSRLRLPDGSPLHPRKRFRVAVNSHVLASGGTRFPTMRRIADEPKSRLDFTTLDTRTLVTEYIRKHSPLSLDSLVGATKK